MRIMLADPPLVHFRLETNYPNMGLLYIISYARSKLEDVEFRYCPARDSLEEHLEEIADYEPDLYGLSFTSIGTENAYSVIKGVKGRFPDLPIVCGGAHPTIQPEEVLTQSPADYCALGEGEAVMVDVIRMIRGEMSREEVLGLAWMAEEGFRTADPRPPIRNLDDLPFPAWDLVAPGDYIGPQVRQQQPVTAVLASRGCPYACVFCSNPVWKLSKPHCRYRSTENLVEEIKLLYKAGYKELYIRSDELNTDLKWAEETAEAIAALGYDDLVFQVNLRADRMSERLAEGLAAMNCWLIHLGIESANDRVLKGIKKHITVDQVVETCQTLKSKGVKVFGFMMMFQAWEEKGRLEYETIQEVNNSLKFTLRMVRRGLLDYISWQIATPVPGAELWHVARRHNLIRTQGPARDMWENHLEIPGVTDRVIKRMRLKGMLLQSYLYLRSGGIQWKHWRKIVAKVKKMVQSV